MKKKSMMLGGLLAAVVVTAYSVSGTYAKYISQVDLTDEARVAKWGFNENINIDLFGTSYTKDGNKYVQSFKNDAEGNLTNVVAPGTSGTSTAKLEGEMETSFVLSFDLVNENDFVVYYNTDADGNVDKTTLSTTAFDGAKEYRPLRYSIAYTKADGSDVTTKVDGNDVAISTLLSDIDINTLKGRLDAYNKNNWTDEANGIANFDHIFLPQTLNRSITISWKWAVRNTTDGSGNTLTKENVDILDTYAGQHLSEVDNVTKFGVKVTAEQVTDGNNTVNADN